MIESGHLNQLDQLIKDAFLTHKVHPQIIGRIGSQNGVRLQRVLESGGELQTKLLASLIEIVVK